MNIVKKTAIAAAGIALLAFTVSCSDDKDDAGSPFPFQQSAVSG